MSKVIILSWFWFALASSCGNNSSNEIKQKAATAEASIDTSHLQRAYFASGCFWCVEAIYESVTGVEEVVSGYSGGTKEDATYEKVGSGYTNHAETVLVYYDSTKVSYKSLLDVFFDSHNPTILNQVGPDRGRQYRSAIFYRNDAEKKLSQIAIDSINQSKYYKNPVVTEVVPFEAFYPAEEYHQDYEKRNPNQPYIRGVSIPRLENFQEKRPELLKEKK